MGRLRAPRRKEIHRVFRAREVDRNGQLLWEPRPRVPLLRPLVQLPECLTGPYAHAGFYRVGKRGAGRHVFAGAYDKKVAMALVPHPK